MFGLGRGDQHRRQARHTVVHLLNDPLRAVLAVRRLVLALDDGESLHDVIDISALDAVEVEIDCVQLAAYEEATLFIPDERRAILTQVAGERLHVPSGVGQFEDAGHDEVEQGGCVCVARDDGKLFQVVLA